MNLLSRRSILLFGLLILGLVLTGCFGGTKEPQTYTVSGVIVDSDDKPIEGVTLHFGSGITVVTTDNNGQWTRSGLTGPTTVTPAHEDYTFDPSSRNVTTNASNINFTATPRTVPHEPLAVTIKVVGDVTNGVAPGQRVTLTAEITGTDASEATIHWTPGAGEITPDQSATTVTWIAPPQVGTWTIGVEATTSSERTYDETQVPVVHTMQCDSGVTNRQNNPCRISTLEQLQAMRHHVDGHFVLAADIDASDSIFLNDGFGFDPIGRNLAPEAPFSGTFNGNNKTISNLYIRVEHSSTCAALFGATSDTAQIKDLTLVNVDASSNCAAGLVGQNRGLIENVTLSSVNIEGFYDPIWTGVTGGLVARNYGTIRSASVSGVVESAYTVGGLVGINQESGVIENAMFSFTAGSRVAGNNRVGGLVGNNEGEITRSRVFLRVSHSITGTNDVGGLVGRVGRFGAATGPYRVTQSFVYGAGDIVGEQNVGGLIGASYQATIESSYAFVNNVEGDEHVGGLIGQMERSDTVTEAYAITRNVIANNDTPGGFVGTRGPSGTVERSYWSSQGQGLAGTSGSEQKTLAQMQQAATFVGWRTSVWQFPAVGDAFPDLRANSRP